MIRQRIHLPNWNWRIMMYYVVSRPNAKEILKELERIGCKGEDLERAEYSLMSGEADTGITYTNVSLGESVVVIARTSNAKEYLESLSHECAHLANHIAIFYGLGLNGEDVRYLCDEIISKTWPISKELLCDECRCIRKEGDYE